MVSERRQQLNVKRPTSSVLELDCKSPYLSSSFPSFREKNFKKSKSSKHSASHNHAFHSRKKPTPQAGHVNPSAHPPATARPSRVPRRKDSSSTSAKPHPSLDSRPHSDIPPINHCNSKLKNSRHSPRAFSLFTLQEYLRERPHITSAAAVSTTHMDNNGVDELDMNLTSSHFLHPADKEADALPLLPLNLQHNYTRKPRKATAQGSHTKSSASKACNCNGTGCKHEGRDEYRPYAGYSTGEEEHVDDSINDEKNEALSIKGYHGCVPWHSLSAVTPKCNKKKMIMDLAGRSFTCGGFPVSKRHNRLRAVGQTVIPPMTAPRSRRGSQWDSMSSNFGSDSALLLSESEAYDAFLHSRCYPGCNSLPGLTRWKQLAERANMDIGSLYSPKFHENELGKSKMQCRRSHTIRKKGKRCRTKVAGSNDGITQSDLSDVGRQNKRGDNKGVAGENGEQHRSLSEKYRPFSFEEMVGQSMVSQALKNALHRGKIAPVYLFQGPRGTGKTCAARIFATSINCSSKDRSTKSTLPCQYCKHCESVSRGKSSSVRIVNANNGIDDMKSLSRFISRAPQQTKYKVLIIDECHMLSKEAWSLFLNTIDQPPRHVVFILIATDTEQLPRMVISKCQKFSFTKIKDADIVSRLWKLSDMEGVDVEQSALQLIASRADGSLFDAEATLDQLTNLGQRITSGLVREMCSTS